MFIKKLIGDRAFYRRVLAVAVPIMIQTGITNLVNLIDNIMVGSLGTEQMSGVSIVNQFLFVFTLLIFGTSAAGGIFTAQYYGKADVGGVQFTFRFKFWVNLIAGVLGVGVFLLAGDRFIGSFLYEGSQSGDLALTLGFGQEYLKIMLVGLIPYALSQAYCTTLRETGHAVIPMAAGFVAVGVNVFLNYVLIFGKFGVAPMGVAGAALATVFSRFAELFFVVLWTHCHPRRCPWNQKAFSRLYIPAGLFGKIAAKGLPLTVNEVLWASSVTLRNQCYATRGIETVAALNISTTVVNMFGVVYMAVGHALAVMVGHHLGAGRLKEAKDTATKMITFSFLCAVGMGLLLVAGAGLFPSLYNTDASVRALAGYAMMISAAFFPFHALSHSSYFALRTGGRVGVTFLLDSGFMWAVVVPTCLLLSRFTAMPIHWLFVCGQAVEGLKAALSLLLLQRVQWVRRLVGSQTKQ